LPENSTPKQPNENCFVGCISKMFLCSLLKVVLHYIQNVVG